MKKDYSLNDEYKGVSFMMKKELIEKIKQKTKEEKTTFKNFVENILIKNL